MSNTWIVCGSEACPSISNNAGSDTKKNLGNMRRFFSKYLLELNFPKVFLAYPERNFWRSFNYLTITMNDIFGKKMPENSNFLPKKLQFWLTYPERDFWQSSNCSRRWGRSWPNISSPTQQLTTLGVSWARVMIFTQLLSILWNLFASCKRVGLSIPELGFGCCHDCYKWQSCVH